MEKNIKKFLAETAVVGATIGCGAYTQLVNWNPTLRSAGHLLGAVAVPGYASLITSSLIKGYEDHKNKKIAKKEKNININEKENNNLEQSKQNEYTMNPKLKSFLMNTGMVAGSLAYMAFCYSWESWQYSQSGVFELSQYVSDFAGPIIGMATIGAIDAKPVFEKIDNLTLKGKEKFNQFKEKIGLKEKSNEKEKTTLKVEEINVDKSKEKQEEPAWNLDLYDNSNSNINENNKLQEKNVKNVKKQDEYLDL